MITEDYILRIIRLAAEFIAKALKLSKEGDFLTSEKTLENGLQDLTGISIDTLKQLDVTALKTITGGDEASIFVLAEFLGTLAEVERQKGMLDLYYIYLKKSLSMYLEITKTDDYATEKPILGIYPKVKEVIYDEKLVTGLIDFFERTGDTAEIPYLEDLLYD
jgi:hypothetical protein